MERDLIFWLKAAVAARAAAGMFFIISDYTAGIPVSSRAVFFVLLYGGLFIMLQKKNRFGVTAAAILPLADIAGSAFSLQVIMLFALDLTVFAGAAVFFRRNGLPKNIFVISAAAIVIISLSACWGWSERPALLFSESRILVPGESWKFELESSGGTLAADMRSSIPVSFSLAENGSIITKSETKSFRRGIVISSGKFAIDVTNGHAWKNSTVRISGFVKG